MSYTLATNSIIEFQPHFPVVLQNEQSFGCLNNLRHSRPCTADSGHAAAWFQLHVLPPKILGLRNVKLPFVHLCSMKTFVTIWFPYERNCQHLPSAPAMNHDRLPTLCVDASGRALLNLGDQQEQQLGGRHGDGLRECLDSFLHGSFGWPRNLLGCLCGVLSQLRYQAAIAAGWPCFGGRFFRNHGCTVVQILGDSDILSQICINVFYSPVAWDSSIFAKTCCGYLLCELAITIFNGVLADIFLTCYQCRFYLYVLLVYIILYYIHFYSYKGSFLVNCISQEQEPFLGWRFLIRDDW